VSDEPPAGGNRPGDGGHPHAPPGDRGHPHAPPDRKDGPREVSASLRLAAGPLAGPVLCRVVSMVLARADCPLDRIGDAMLICDALSAHAPAQANDGMVAFAVSLRGGTMELRIGEFQESGASRLVRAAVLPGVGNVLEHTADELRIEPATDGGGEELVLGLAF
jgi:hypothetical protein